MTALRELQQAFQGAVLAASDAPLEGPWTGPEGAGMAVYRHGCRARLVEVLALEFPKLAAWLGAPAFARAANDYVDTHPARQPSVRDFGAAFPAFLARHATVHDARRCAALARFEWALGAVFDAPDAALLTADMLAALPPADWPALRLRLVPAVRCCRCDPGVVALWQRLDGGEVDAVLPPPARTARHLVWRHGTRVHFRPLAAGEALAVRLLRHGPRLAGLCGALAVALPEAASAEAVARLLRRFAALGILRAPEVVRSRFPS